METGSVTVDQNRQISRSAARRRQFEYQTVISSTEQQSANLFTWDRLESRLELRGGEGVSRGINLRSRTSDFDSRSRQSRGSRDYFITSPFSRKEKKILHLVFWGNQRSMLAQTLPVITIQCRDWSHWSLCIGWSRRKTLFLVVCEAIGPCGNDPPHAATREGPGEVRSSIGSAACGRNDGVGHEPNVWVTPWIFLSFFPFTSSMPRPSTCLPCRSVSLPVSFPFSKSLCFPTAVHAKWSAPLSLHASPPRARFLNFLFQKCDGNLPSCSRCVRTNRIASCTYDLPLHKKHGVSALQKGEACIPCRSVPLSFF